MSTLACIALVSIPEIKADRNYDLQRKQVQRANWEGGKKR